MKFEIDVQKREQAGKGVARQLRRNGRIPAVFYGNGQSLLLSMDPKVARHIIMSQAEIPTNILSNFFRQSGVGISSEEFKISIHQDTRSPQKPDR